MSNLAKWQATLTKTLSNPLIEKSKKSDLWETFGHYNSSKTPDKNQITMEMDTFENRLIKRRRIKE